VDLEHLVVHELAVLAEVTERRDHEMPRRVGEPIQEREGPLTAANHELLLVVTFLREAEDAPRLLVRGLDVFEAPRGPERLRHAAYSNIRGTSRSRVVR
jgi:hypothetical protein